MMIELGGNCEYENGRLRNVPKHNYNVMIELGGYCEYEKGRLRNVKRMT